MAGLNPIMEQKLNDAVGPLDLPPITRRDACLPPVPGKVHAVVGMRRVGKTTFLHQLQAEWRETLPPERVLCFGFDDDRLENLGSEQLNLLLEEYFRRYPDHRSSQIVYWLLDEVQLVSGWDRFLRRAKDTEKMEFVVSGSSARLLSREVHTALRGRSIETRIGPFSFREYLRHHGVLPDKPPGQLTSRERSLIESRFRDYLVTGGFPEAQGLSTALRVQLLQGYVDAVLFRDILERHGFSQVAALRWLTRHCLRNPARPLSVHRMYQDLRAQGLAVGKDTLHAMIGALEDAFLLRPLFLATESERRRNTNPRRFYPVDAGLLGAFDRSGRVNLGHALETVVLHELDRRAVETGYVLTPGGFEVDFLSRQAEGGECLLQVCADPTEPSTLDRELRALDDATQLHPRAKKCLLVLTADQVPVPGPKDIRILPAWQWLLEAPSASVPRANVGYHL